MDSRLHVKHDLSHAHVRNSIFFADPSRRAHLGSQLLLYDTVIIPTNDFGVLSGLITWFGLRHFEEALDSRAITFLRRHGLLGYAGNGNGISTFVIQPGPGRSFEWWQEALFGEDLHSSIVLQLKHAVPYLSFKARAKLADRVLAASESVDYANDLFIKDVAQESYADIRDTPELASAIVSLTGAATPINLERLPTVQPDQIQLASEGDLISAADLVVRVAETNMELILGDLGGRADIHTSVGAENILRAKLRRSQRGAVLADGFLRLLDLNQVPDIRIGIESSAIPLPELWKLRQKKVAKRFREWLRRAAVEEGRDLERQYVASLGRSSAVQSLPARIIRFGITSAAGIANPVIGAASSAGDSFFVEKYLAGYRPKLMFDELRALLPTKD